VRLSIFRKEECSHLQLERKSEAIFNWRGEVRPYITGKKSEAISD
jgi:hypothetical protein